MYNTLHAVVSKSGLLRRERANGGNFKERPQHFGIGRSCMTLLPYRLMHVVTYWPGYVYSHVLREREREREGLRERVNTCHGWCLWLAVLTLILICLECESVSGLVIVIVLSRVTVTRQQCQEVKHDSMCRPRVCTCFAVSSRLITGLVEIQKKRACQAKRVCLSGPCCKDPGIPVGASSISTGVCPATIGWS